MVTCLQTLSKVAKVKVLIHSYGLSLIHFFFCFLFLLSFLMLPILPPFSSPVNNISEFFKIFRKFFQEAFKVFQISPTKKVL